jgi:hypothetical protein
MWPETQPKKFVIWGHLHYTHTHSYIHYGFAKAAQSMGWDVVWTKSTEGLENTDEYLFLTEGSAESGMPINSKAFYILHNCDMNKYISIPNSNKVVLQVFTKDVLSRPAALLKDKLFEYWQENINTFYMPWATDILPAEIDENMKKIPFHHSGKAVFIGSQWGGVHGNNNELAKFKIGCDRNWLKFDIINSQKVEQAESIRLIQCAYLAPSIVGQWQKEKGYIPCRIFKTISYGQLGVTNSNEAYEAVNKLCIYSAKEEDLVDLAVASNHIEMTKKAMEFVRDKHTYINRIESLREIFKIKMSS